jgi:hypothetical protein
VLLPVPRRGRSRLTEERAGAAAWEAPSGGAAVELNRYPGTLACSARMVFSSLGSTSVTRLDTADWFDCNASSAKACP